jgi:hypothetical protein
MVCTSGACSTCEMGEEEDVGFEEGKDEWKKGRRGALRHIAREACVVHGISLVVATPQSASPSVLVRKERD